MKNSSIVFCITQETYMIDKLEVSKKIYKIGNTSFNYATNELITGNIKTIITSRQSYILHDSQLLIKSIIKDDIC